MSTTNGSGRPPEPVQRSCRRWHGIGQQSAKQRVAVVPWYESQQLLDERHTTFATAAEMDMRRVATLGRGANRGQARSSNATSLYGVAEDRVAPASWGKRGPLLC